jgi:hypothetical protein
MAVGNLNYKRNLVVRQVAELRSMIAVPYFEKALYEMPEEQLTSASLMALADQVEKEIQGGPSGLDLR